MFCNEVWGHSATPHLQLLEERMGSHPVNFAVPNGGNRPHVSVTALLAGYSISEVQAFETVDRSIWAVNPEICMEQRLHPTGTPCCL